MALLQVKNFSDEIYNEIKNMAKKEKRTIAKQAEVLIEEGLEKSNIKELTPKEKRIRALKYVWEREEPLLKSDTDYVKSIREDRDKGHRWPLY